MLHPRGRPPTIASRSILVSPTIKSLLILVAFVCALAARAATYDGGPATPGEKLLLGAIASTMLGVAAGSLMTMQAEPAPSGKKELIASVVVFAALTVTCAIGALVTPSFLVLAGAIGLPSLLFTAITAYQAINTSAPRPDANPDGTVGRQP